MAKKLLLLTFFALSLTLDAAGLRYCLPSAARTAMAVEPSQLPQLTPALEKTREEIYGSYAKSSQIGLLKYFRRGEGTLEVRLNGATRTVEKRTLDLIRGALLQSEVPDDQNTIRALAAIKPAELQFNPHFYQYGGVYLYPLGAFLKAAATAGLFRITGDVKYYFTHPQDAGDIYAYARLWGGLAGAAGVFLMFALGRRLYGTAAGLLAAFFYAALPMNAVEAHYFKPFFFFVPLLLGALLFCLRVADEGRLRDYLLAGLLTGLGAGAVIFTWAAVLPALAAHLLRLRGEGRPLKEAFGARRAAGPLLYLAAAAGAFFLFNPYWLLTPAEVLREFHHLLAGAPMGGGAARAAVYFFSELPKAFGWPLWLLCACGLAAAALRRRPGDIVLLALIIPFYFYISLSHPGAVHYAMPLVPPLVLLGAALGSSLAGVTKRPAARAAAAALALTAGYTLLLSAHYDAVFLRPSARTLAGEWLNANARKGTSVAWDTDGPLYFRFLDHTEPACLPQEPACRPDYLVLPAGADVPAGYALAAAAGYGKSLAERLLPSPLTYQLLSAGLRVYRRRE